MSIDVGEGLRGIQPVAEVFRADSAYSVTPVLPNSGSAFRSVWRNGKPKVLKYYTGLSTAMTPCIIGSEYSLTQ